MLALNVAGVVDLSPVLDQVKNILLVSQTGIAIGDTIADILLGQSYPSGKLASTWARWEDYNTKDHFGDQEDTQYCEGIYIGYRYFDTAGVKPVFPFGYGLGYTTFDLKFAAPTVCGTTVQVPVTVTNTGSSRGKEVVQIYVSKPTGKLDQPYQVLAGFAKTRELQAGDNKLKLAACGIDCAGCGSYKVTMQHG